MNISKSLFTFFALTTMESRLPFRIFVCHCIWHCRISEVRPLDLTSFKRNTSYNLIMSIIFYYSCNLKYITKFTFYLITVLILQSSINILFYRFVVMIESLQCMDKIKIYNLHLFINTFKCNHCIHKQII